MRVSLLFEVNDVVNISKTKAMVAKQIFIATPTEGFAGIGSDMLITEQENNVNFNFKNLMYVCMCYI